MPLLISRHEVDHWRMHMYIYMCCNCIPQEMLSVYVHDCYLCTDLQKLATQFRVSDAGNFTSQLVAILTNAPVDDFGLVGGDAVQQAAFALVEELLGNHQLDQSVNLYANSTVSKRRNCNVSGAHAPSLWQMDVGC